MKIENWSLSRLFEPARKLRNNEKQIERMASALAEFGFRLPVLAKGTGEIVDGALRVKAARLLGLPEIPVIVIDDLPDEKIRALRLLLNRSASWASWDENGLALELADLASLKLDLSLTGFDPGELEKYLKLAQAFGDESDSAPPLEKTPVSRQGDLWLLGGHRLYCGDATDPGSFQALLAGRPADCVWTDPPYGVAYTGASKKRKGILNDSLSGNSFAAFLASAFANMEASLKPGGSCYAACAIMTIPVFLSVLTNSGLTPVSSLVWIKNHFVISRGDYHSRHEQILYCRKPGGHFWFGGRKQHSVREVFPAAIHGVDESGADCWQIIDGGNIYRVTGRDLKVEELAGDVFYAPKPAASALHPTMKPVALISAMLKNSALPGEIVLDPFSGSGSTLMACESLGMRCAAMELDPLYADCIVRRWQEATGLLAFHADGPAFDERAAA